MIKLLKKKNMRTLRLFGEKGLSFSLFKNQDGICLIFAVPTGYAGIGMTNDREFFCWPWRNKELVLK